MKKVLILTNTFLPDDNGRAERLLARARYLRSNGWEPIILIGQESITRKSASINQAEYIIYRNHEKNNTSETNSTTENGRKEIIKKFARYFTFPDNYMTYFPRLIFNTRKVIKNEDIDVLYTMNYPFSFHLIGLIMSNIYNIAWLAEFRDAWVTNPYHFSGSANIFHRFLEKQVVQNCDAIVYNYGVQIPKDYFTNTYNIPGEEVFQLNCPGSCGFDFERYSHIKPLEFDSFSITYAGSFHGDAHSPEPFLFALSKFISNKEISKGDIRVDFFGDWSKQYNRQVSKLDLEEVINYHGWVSHEEAFRYMCGSDVLLAIIRPYPGDELNVPSKIVDYIAAEKPILILVDKDWEAASFIQRHGLGEVAAPNNIGDIKSKMNEFYQLYQTENLSKYRPSKDLLDMIDVRTQTDMFAEALSKTEESNKE